MNRAAGILLPVSSLPSRYGIGCFSRSAYAFVDWLKEAGQSYWQILPLGPTSYGDSPYQSFSTYAGNPYFIDLEQLTQEIFLEEYFQPHEFDLHEDEDLLWELICDIGPLLDRRGGAGRLGPFRRGAVKGGTAFGTQIRYSKGDHPLPVRLDDAD